MFACAQSLDSSVSALAGIALQALRGAMEKLAHVTVLFVTSANARTCAAFVHSHLAGQSLTHPRIVSPTSWLGMKSNIQSRGHSVSDKSAFAMIKSPGR